ncbi:hypothetical protein B566_EDAN017968 [Ephemera danica]|nr:hypothetical protein B566_EDAN017968 [Ephemera danica]
MKQQVPLKSLDDGCRIPRPTTLAGQMIVKAACGPAQWVDNTSATNNNNGSALTSTWSPPSPAVDVTEEPRITSLLHGVIASLARSKRFYAGLADTLCSDDSYAETAEDADCWNVNETKQRAMCKGGFKLVPSFNPTSFRVNLAMRRYTKTVVGAGVGAQKYNPELAWGSRHQPDSRIAQLSDRLRHTRQLLLGQLSTSLEADSLLMDQGSGSGYSAGRSGSWPGGDDEDATEDWEGSGSGDHPIDPEKPSKVRILLGEVRSGPQTNGGPIKETTGSTGRTNPGNPSSGPRNHVISWTSLFSTLLLVWLLQCRA